MMTEVINLEKSIDTLHKYLVKCQRELIKLTAMSKGAPPSSITAPFSASIESEEGYTRIVFETCPPKIRDFMDSSVWRDMFFAAIMEAALGKSVPRYNNAIIVITVHTSSKIPWDTDHFPLNSLINAIKLSGIIREDNYSTLSIAIEGVQDDKDFIEVIIRNKNISFREIAISHFVECQGS